MSEALMMPAIVFFVKAKRDLDVLPPFHGALELHITGQTIKLRYGCK